MPTDAVATGWAWQSAVYQVNHVLFRDYLVLRYSASLWSMGWHISKWRKEYHEFSHNFKRLFLSGNNIIYTIFYELALRKMRCNIGGPLDRECFKCDALCHCAIRCKKTCSHWWWWIIYEDYRLFCDHRRWYVKYISSVPCPCTVSKDTQGSTSTFKYHIWRISSILRWTWGPIHMKSIWNHISITAMKFVWTTQKCTGYSTRASREVHMNFSKILYEMKSNLFIWNSQEVHINVVWNSNELLLNFIWNEIKFIHMNLHAVRMKFIWTSYRRTNEVSMLYPCNSNEDDIRLMNSSLEIHMKFICISNDLNFMWTS